MSSITTPDPDRTPPSGYRTAESRPDTPDATPARPRLITTTDELLGEILRRPGQKFIARTAMRPIGEDVWTFLEFADGTKVEVQSA